MSSPIERVPKRLLTAGQWADAASRATTPVEDPATGLPV
jgi:hypothetical protein